ncbi:hypothetical protein O3P69_000921 [Scylla paramamosain]|uniref:Uncharacterized protein n=1 Tax=Scylla paramamosain TaxID=85552 RepID=A0AAW0UWG8_SCYPA
MGTDLETCSYCKKRNSRCDERVLGYRGALVEGEMGGRLLGNHGGEVEVKVKASVTMYQAAASGGWHEWRRGAVACLWMLCECVAARRWFACGCFECGVAARYCAFSVRHHVISPRSFTSRITEENGKEQWRDQRLVKMQLTMVMMVKQLRVSCSVTMERSVSECD